jgi:hypothetical protein
MCVFTARHVPFCPYCMSDRAKWGSQLFSLIQILLLLQVILSCFLIHPHMAGEWNAVRSVQHVRLSTNGYPQEGDNCQNRQRLSEIPASFLPKGPRNGGAELNYYLYVAATVMTPTRDGAADHSKIVNCAFFSSNSPSPLFRFV